jgi:hypothetical protein
LQSCFGEGSLAAVHTLLLPVAAVYAKGAAICCLRCAVTCARGCRDLLEGAVTCQKVPLSMLEGAAPILRVPLPVEKGTLAARGKF